MPKRRNPHKSPKSQINYIHANPVRRQYVKRPEDWVWSSANPDNEIVIEPVFL